MCVCVCVCVVMGACAGVDVIVYIYGIFFVLSFLPFFTDESCLPRSPQVTSSDAGDTRSHSARDRRLCHCSAAVRWALSIRRQWLDSEGPEEYWPMTILPMKSLLLFMLWPNTSQRGERRRGQDRRQEQDRGVSLHTLQLQMQGPRFQDTVTFNHENSPIPSSSSHESLGCNFKLLTHRLTTLSSGHYSQTVLVELPATSGVQLST